MKQLYILVFLLSVVFQACYEDLGNYDYKEINELTVEGINESYYIDLGEHLQITPDLSGTIYNKDEKFSYEWVVGDEVVATTKNLDLFINMTLGEKLCRYIITDNTTGVKEIRLFRIHVSSDTGGDVLMVLSHYKGRAELSYLRLDREGYDFVKNYFQERNQFNLGSEGQSLQRNYNVFDINTGVQVLTKEGVVCLDHNTLEPLGEDGYLDERFIRNYFPPYPQPNLTGFHVEFIKHYVNSYRYNPYGKVTLSSQADMISGGNYYYMFLTDFTKVIKVNLTSPLGGKLSPVVFREYVKPTSSDDLRPGNYARGYTLSPIALVFDKEAGRFLRSYNGGPLYDLGNLSSYPGYDLVYGSHTSDNINSVAVLTGDTESKLVMINDPGDTKNHAIVGEATVNKSVINASSKFYTLNYSPYMLIATGNKIYRYNLLNIQSGIGPQAVITTLSKYGYDDNAKITAMFMTRTEKHLVLGVSRYGTDTAGMSDELKGDVLIIKANQDSGYELVAKYEGATGYPVDVMIKYKYYYRDGEDKNGILIDNL